MKLRKIEIAILVSLAVTLLYSLVLSTSRDALALDIVRLRVVANSDSEDDQNLKFAVRDAVTAYLQAPLNSASGSAESLLIIGENLDNITEAAQKAVISNGYSYPVRAEITKEDFATRYYEDFTLPAGVYDSLRITIGEGEGHNWWCVIFPALCREVVQKESAETAYNKLTESEKKLISDDKGGKAKIKFGVLEGIRTLRRLFG